MVEVGKEAEFLAPLPVKRLWGVGKKTLPALALLKVQTIGDLTLLPLELLEKKFGRPGSHMYYCARGIDHRAVEPAQEIKSIGNEETFARDLVDLSVIKKELLALAVKVAERLCGQNYQGRTITLKIRYHDFETRSHSTSLKQATDDAQQLYKKVMSLLADTLAGKKAVRLVGISVAKLVVGASPQQLDLFGLRAATERRELNRAMDRINRRYGPDTIRPALLAGRSKGK